MSHMLGRILVSTRDDVSSFSVGVPEALISSHSERSGGEPGAGPGCGVAVGVGDSSGGNVALHRKKLSNFAAIFNHNL